METTAFNFDIFISFATEDYETAKQAAEILEANGLKVFFSSKTLKNKVGQSYLDVIFNSMENSEHLLLVTSQHSMASEWVNEEYKTFYNEIALPSKHQRRILIYNFNPEFEVKKLPLYLRKHQIADKLDQILESLGKSPAQADPGKHDNPDVINEPKKPVKEIKPKKPRVKKEIKEEEDQMEPLEMISGVNMFLILDGEEKHFTGRLDCYELMWWFNGQDYTRIVTLVVDVRMITHAGVEWIEIIHVIDSARNYCYFGSGDAQLRKKLYKLALIVKAHCSGEAEVIRELAVLEAERKEPIVQQPPVTQTFQKGNVIATYNEVWFRHWDERSLAFGTTKSSSVAGIFTVRSNCFEFISTEFNILIFNIYDIYFCNQNAEYVNNYMKVDYLEKDGLNYTYLFYRFSFLGDSPTMKMYNEIANLYHQGLLLFEGR